MPPIKFNQDFDPKHGQAVKINENITRITAKNESPFTYRGTNTYLLGTDQLALIDPGPKDQAHLELILKTIGERTLTHIFVTHTHNDHSSLAFDLKQRTGAKILAEGGYRPARELRADEVNPLQESNDQAFIPDVELSDGEIISGDS